MKEATWPRARLLVKTTVKNPPSWKFVTTTPTSVLLPQLVTVPLIVMRPFSPTPGRQNAEIRTQGRFTSVLSPWKPPPMLSVSF